MCVEGRVLSYENVTYCNLCPKRPSKNPTSHKFASTLSLSIVYNSGFAFVVMTSPRQNNRSFVLRSDGVRERKSAMVRLIARFWETRRVFKDRQVARDRLVGCYSHLTIVVVFTLNPNERLMSGQRVYEVISLQDRLGRPC